MLVAAALAVLFVVVCPIAPTPTAVIGGQAPSLMMALAFALAVLLPIAVPVQTRARMPLAVKAPAPTSADLLDLTCTRLC
jgi:hypothetical protein